MESLIVIYVFGSMFSGLLCLLATESPVESLAAALLWPLALVLLIVIGAFKLFDRAMREL